MDLNAIDQRVQEWEKLQHVYKKVMCEQCNAETRTAVREIFSQVAMLLPSLGEEIDKIDEHDGMGAALRLGELLSLHTRLDHLHRVFAMIINEMAGHELVNRT